MKMLKMFLMVVVLIGNVNVMGASAWKDNLKKVGDGVKNVAEKTKETSENAKKKWKDSERRCDICNKVIHARNRCASCQIKRVSDKIKQTNDSVQKSWNDKAKPCSACGEIIHIGTMCRKCISKAVQTHGSSVVRNINVKARKMYSSAKSSYGQTLDKIRDPKVREKATATVGAILEIRGQIKAAKRMGAYKGFDLLASVPVGNGETFGDIAISRLLEKYPELTSTGLCDDPAETAAAIVCYDSKFFLSEVKPIRKDGENVSVYEAISKSSSFDASQTIKYLKIAEATGDVAYSLESGEDVGKAVGSVFSAIETVNKK